MKDKKVLLIAPAFFGYSAEIERQLQAWGATVYRYENRASTSAWGKAVVRLFPEIWAPVTDGYYARIFERHRHEAIDYLFVIRGEGLTAGTMRRFAGLFPEAKKVLYLWDSFKNDKGAVERIAHFDLISSFDLEDARSDHRLRFLPLFYLSRFSEIRSRSPDIDLCFIGTMHTDRYAVLKRLLGTIESRYSVHCFLYFPNRTLYRLRRLVSPQFWGAESAEFSFEPLGGGEVLDLFGRARAIIDVERAVQTGLTMRSLETLGAQRKLITTNASVREYDFYDERNIAVIDRRNPRLPAGFLDTAYHATPSALLDKYGVEHWLKVALGIERLEGYGPCVIPPASSENG